MHAFTPPHPPLPSNPVFFPVIWRSSPADDPEHVVMTLPTARRQAGVILAQVLGTHLFCCIRKPGHWSVPPAASPQSVCCGKVRHQSAFFFSFIILRPTFSDLALVEHWVAVTSPLHHLVAPPLRGSPYSQTPGVSVLPGSLLFSQANTPSRFLQWHTPQVTISHFVLKLLDALS